MMAEQQLQYRWDSTWGANKQNHYSAWDVDLKIGRIYQATGAPPDSVWFWAMTALIKEVGTPRVVQGSERGVAGTREAASHKVEQEYRKLRAQAVSMGFMLKEPPL